MMITAISEEIQVLRNSRPCYQNCWHTDVIGYLNALAVNGAGYTADRPYELPPNLWMSMRKFSYYRSTYAGDDKTYQQY